MRLYEVRIPDLVPAGEKGIAKVKHVTVSKDEASRTSLRAFQHPGAYVAAGDYAQLFVGHTLMMSDTSMERRSNMEFVHRAHGRILVAGLGLGLILFPLVDNPEVKHVTVVEKYQDVIDLVGPALKAKFGDRLEIICADILDWKPAKGTKYNVIYFDIWPEICETNLEEITRLHRKFARNLDRSDPRCLMNSWMKEALQAQRRREKDDPCQYGFRRRTG